MKRQSAKRPIYRSTKQQTLLGKFRTLPRHTQFLLLILIVAVGSALGTWAYTVYKSRDLQAQARGVTLVYNTPRGINVSMCKRSQGDIAAVRVYFIAQNTNERPETRVKVYDYTKGGYQGDVKNNGWLFGTMYTTVFTKTNTSVSATYPGYKSKLYTVAYLQDCP